MATPVAVLDAKYRDLWEESSAALARSHQVATLRGGSRGSRTATILYRHDCGQPPGESRLVVRDPLRGTHVAQVCLRPVV